MKVVLLFFVAQLHFGQVSSWYGCQWENVPNLTTELYLNGGLTNSSQCVAHGTVVKLMKQNNGGIFTEAICLDGKWHPDSPAHLATLPYPTSVSQACKRPTLVEPSRQLLYSSDYGTTWAHNNTIADSTIVEQVCPNGTVRRSICLAANKTWAPETCGDLQNPTDSVYWPFTTGPQCTLPKETYSATIASPTQASGFVKIKAQLTWLDGQHLCKRRGGRLASIRSDIDQISAASLAGDCAGTESTSGYWIGGLSYVEDGSFHWADDNATIKLSNWAASQPDGGNPSCIRILSTGQWDNFDCETALEGTICAIGPGTKTTTMSDAWTYMKMENHLRTYDQAVGSCANQNGRLASIKSQEDHQSVLNTLAGTGSADSYWTGGRRNANGEPYIWASDNSTIELFNWDLAQSNSYDSQPPLCIGVSKSGKWAIHSCQGTQLGGVLCEVPVSSTTTTQASTTGTTETRKTSTTIYPTSTFSEATSSKTSTSATAQKMTTQKASAAKKALVNLLQLMIPLQGKQRSEPKETTSAVTQRCNHFSANRLAPPLLRPEEPLKITMGLQAMSLIEISNLAEEMSVEAFMLLKWSIDTCPWSSSSSVSDRPQEEVQLVSMDDVWLPRLRFTNAANGNVYMKDALVGDDFLVTMETEKKNENRSYQFYWTREGAFTADCTLQLEKFPFDKQTCSLDFSLQRGENLVEFDSNPVFYFPNEAVENTEWQVVSTSTSVDSQRFNGYMVSTVSLVVTLQRIPTFYIRHFFIPCAVLTGFNIAAFFIPPEQADRPVFAATIVVAFTVSQSEVLYYIPKKPTGNLLSGYLELITWLTVATGIYELFALWLSSSAYSKKHPQPALNICGRRITLVRFLDVGVAAAASAAFSVATFIFLTNV